jgi:hypothetical protein
MAVSPFISGSYRQLPGQQTSIDRPDRVQPVPEHVKGPEFPYRGTETHGVDPNNDPGEYYEGDSWDDTDDTERPLPPIPEVDPIPVRIVQHESRERTEFRVQRFSVTDQIQNLLGRHEMRKNLRIRVHAFKTDGTANTDPVYIGADNGLKSYTGFEIAAGTTERDFSSTEDYWAIANAGTTVEISLYYEFGVEL